MAHQDADKDSEYLSVGEAAALIGVSKDTLRRWEAKGHITLAARTPTGHRRFRRDDIEGLMAS